METLFSFFDIEKDVELTPVEKHGDIYFKRDDKFVIGAANGGKARSAYMLMKNATGVVTAGARKSPQIQIVAIIAEQLKIPCYAQTTFGSKTRELEIAESHGAEIIFNTDTWHNSVIIGRAKKFALENNLTNIPFGMECWDAVKHTAMQVQNIPANIERIIMPIGSGMSFSGVLWGLDIFHRNIKVVGIQVGANPEKRLSIYAPKSYKLNSEIIKSEYEYSKPAKELILNGVELDEIYEAKCIPYVKPNDLFWIVGKGLRE